ncbi:MAG: nucleotidyltransferase family protein [Candidatus Bathyarchaeia archaeon]
MLPKSKIQDLPKDLMKEGLEEKLIEVCERNNIVFMAIFGSFARGEQKSESDIDVAIEFDRDSGKSLLDLIRIEEEMSEVFGRKVDLGIFSSINPHIIDDIKREMIIVYKKR